MHIVCVMTGARATPKRVGSVAGDRRRSVTLVEDPDGADEAATESTFSAAGARFRQLPAACAVGVSRAGAPHGFGALLDLPALAGGYALDGPEHDLKVLFGQPALDLFLVPEVDRAFDEDADGRVAGARSAFHFPTIDARQVRRTRAAAAIAVTAVPYDLPAQFPHCASPCRSFHLP